MSTSVQKLEKVKTVPNSEPAPNSVEQLFAVYFFTAAAATAVRWLGNLWLGAALAPLLVDGILVLVLSGFGGWSRKTQRIDRLTELFLLLTQVGIAVLWLCFIPVYTLLPPIVLLLIFVYLLFVNRGAYFWGTVGGSLVIVVAALSLQWTQQTQLLTVELTSVTWQHYTLLTLYLSAVVVILLGYVQRRIARERREALLNTRALELARREAEQKSELFAQLRALQSDFFLEEDLQPTFDKLLRQLIDFTDSTLGFLAEVKVDDDNTLLETKIHARAYNASFQQLSPAAQQRHLAAAFRLMVKAGRPTIDNEPQTTYKEADLFGVYNFLSLPVMYNYKVVGHVLLANRAGGYDSPQIEALDPLLSTYGSVLQNIRLKRAQRAYEDQLREAKELAEQNNRLKSQFLTNVSHELRTPLSLIMGPLHVLKQLPFEELTVEQWQQYLTTMERNSQRMLDYLEDILDLTKLDEQKLSVHRQTVDLYHLVEESYRYFEMESPLQQLTYRLDYGLHRGLRVHTDPKKFQKILNHLLSNAFKYTPEGGEVLIRARLKERAVLLSVCDTGKGIPAEHHERIFNRFYQVEEPNETIFAGTGVGLAICRELAHVLNLELQVDSTAGEGSCFTVVIPPDQLSGTVAAVAATTTHTATPSAATAGPDVPQKPRVLVAEDNRDMRLFLEQILKVEYEVVLAENGRRAWEQLQRRPHAFDLLITDLMMPEMDGYALLERVHAQAWAARLPVVVLTAKTQFDARLGNLRIGMDDYLTKPFEVGELLATVQYLLGNRVSR